MIRKFWDLSTHDLGLEIVSKDIPSMTVPDMSMSVRQILDRYSATGAVGDFSRDVLYDVPQGTSDEFLDAYERYDDNPDDLTRAIEQENQFKFDLKSRRDRANSIKISKEREVEQLKQKQKNEKDQSESATEVKSE